jgi:hypothetical protein
MSNKYYWFDSTETKIVEYVNSNDVVERELIYKDHLQEPLRRIVEAMFSSFLFDKILATVDRSDAINECLSFVHINILPKINLDKGFAFGYINICVKRYFQHWNMRLTNYNIQHETLVNLTSQGIEEDNDTRIELSTNDKLHSSLDVAEYLGFLIQYLELKGGKLCRSKIQKHGLQVFIQSLKNPDLVGENKCEFFKVAKEENVAPYQFTLVLRKCRKVHKVLFAEYKNTGTVDLTKKYQF